MSKKQLLQRRAARRAREQQEQAARGRALKARDAEQALPPVIIPLPPRPFYWRDVAGLVVGLPLILVIGTWPVVLLVGSAFMTDHVVLRDNSIAFGWSLYPAWLASSAAVFGICWPSYLFKSNPPEPWGSIWWLGGMLAAMGTGVSLFLMHHVVLDPDVHEKANMLRGRYLYTMPITVRSVSWSPNTVTFSTPHAKVPELDYYNVDLETPVGTVLCVDVKEGWLGGQWTSTPKPCLLASGQHMATRAELLHPAR